MGIFTTLSKKQPNRWPCFLAVQAISLLAASLASPGTAWGTIRMVSDTSVAAVLAGASAPFTLAAKDDALAAGYLDGNSRLGAAWTPDGLQDLQFTPIETQFDGRLNQASMPGVAFDPGENH